MLSAVRAGGTTLEQRRRLAAEAFVHTATYDVAVASWMGSVLTDTLRRHRVPRLGRGDLGQGGGAPLRREPAPAGGALPQLGTAGWPAPSSCTARRCPTTTTSTPTPPAGRRYDFTEPAVAIIKHANPCGIAVGADVAEAHRKAHACDPVSAFGGVIATNVPVSVAMAEQVAEIFTEVVVAPGYEDGAVEVLAAQEEHPGAASARPTRPRPRWSSAGSAAAC